MKTMLYRILLIQVFLACALVQNRAFAQGNRKELTLRISHRYLNLPVSQEAGRVRMSFRAEGVPDLDFVIRLAPDKVDYWVFYDLAAYAGKEMKIICEGPETGLSKIYQDDRINGADSLYHERNRPQVHFTSRRGWNNDPNGLVWYEGEYHLFYQHNPFEREWENMSWGHAVSKDLVHWEELPVVMVPDKLGSIYSGTVVIDENNSSGFGKNGVPPMVAVYTSDSPAGERQCIAWSLDRGRTFTKYEGNPVLDSKERWKTHDLRDPAVFWHKPSGQWVMVLYEKDGNSVYTSKNLKNWAYRSHTTGFFECPQLFELPVDGNPADTRWVMYGASGTYMTGRFDGITFTPESGKHAFGNGAVYAAQTFNHIPSADGRRIQIGWGRITHPGMPFKHLMLLPTELALRKTREGIRLFSTPVREINSLEGKESVFNGTEPGLAEKFLQQFAGLDALRIRVTLQLSHSTSAGLKISGQPVLDYDMNYSLVNGAFYNPENMTGTEISADIIVDRTSVEVFIDGGAFSYALERKAIAGNKEGFRFFGKEITIKNLKVSPLTSIWDPKAPTKQ